MDINCEDTFCCQPTCIRLSATLPSDIPSALRMTKWMEVRRRNVTRERVVNTFLGVRVPPVVTYTVNTSHVMKVTDTIIKPRLQARMRAP